MLPILLGASVGQTSRARPAFITLGFVVSFSVVALLFGAFAESLGASEAVLREIAIALLLVFGALMIFPHPFRILTARMHGVVNRAHNFGAEAGSGNDPVEGSGALHRPQDDLAGDLGKQSVRPATAVMLILRPYVALRRASIIRPPSQRRGLARPWCHSRRIAWWHWPGAIWG